MRARGVVVATLGVALLFLGCTARQQTQVVPESRVPPTQKIRRDSLAVAGPEARVPAEQAAQRGSALPRPERLIRECIRWPGQALDIDVADLGTDGTEELFLLTADSVLVFSDAAKLSSFGLSAGCADWVSRNNIGAMVVDGATGTVYLNTSDLASGEVHRWNGVRFEDLHQPLSAFPVALRPTDSGAEPILKKWVPGTDYFVEKTTTFDDDLGERSETLYFYASASGDIDADQAGPEDILLGLDGRITVYDEFFSLVQSDERVFGDFARLFGTRLVVTSARALGEGDYCVVLQWEGGEWVEVHRSRDYAGPLVSAALGDLDRDGQDELVLAEQAGTPERPLTIIHLDTWP